MVNILDQSVEETDRRWRRVYGFMNKDLIILLTVIGLFVAGMTWYHFSTPSPFNSEVFFGK